MKHPVYWSVVVTILPFAVALPATALIVEPATKDAVICQIVTIIAMIFLIVAGPPTFYILVELFFPHDRQQNICGTR